MAFFRLFFPYSLNLNMTNQVKGPEAYTVQNTSCFHTTTTPHPPRQKKEKKRQCQKGPAPGRPEMVVFLWRPFETNQNGLPYFKKKKKRLPPSQEKKKTKKPNASIYSPFSRVSTLPPPPSTRRGADGITNHQAPQQRKVELHAGHLARVLRIRFGTRPFSDPRTATRSSSWGEMGSTTKR